QVRSIVNLNERVDALTSEMKRLREVKDDLKARVDQAELDGFRRTNEVNGWLEAVDAVEVEVNLVVDRLAVYGWSSCGGGRCKLSKKVDKLVTDIKNMKDEGESIVNVTGGYVPPAVEMIPTRPIMGQELIRQRVQQCLEDGAWIIAIYGMGGLGKTTLLKNINNQFLTKTHNYDVVIWVLISRDFVADRFQQAVAARLGLPWEEAENQQQRASKIHRILMRKKFLLLLDDVWEAESWQLFCSKALGSKILHNQSVKPYAEAILSKCRGLPLALITMGRAMSNKETEEEWKHAADVIAKSPSELRGMEGVFTLLKFSYDNLDNEVLEIKHGKCFLYCTLFPDDYSIDKEHLIDYWIGEGIILDSSYGLGHAVIGSLITATKHIVQASAGLTSAPKADVWKDAVRISLLGNGITELSEVPTCPNMSTLLLQWNNRLHNGFFSHMPVMRILDLSFTGLREIPVCISQLAELRHLDPSGNKISRLPEEIGPLSNLGHLDLQQTYFLIRIPSEAIAGLSQLQVLNLCSSYRFWGVQDSDGHNDVCFEDLEGLKSLVTLGIIVTDLASLKQLSNMKGLLKCVKYLHFTDCQDVLHIELISAPRDGEILRKLTIDNCYNLRNLIIGKDAGQRWLPSLKELSLVDLPNLVSLQNLWSLTEFPSLKALSIRDLPKLRNFSRQALAFPSLRKIAVIDCPNLKKLP
uniref:AAA+ ATPase domain-containing protein n=1 Tax=Kalanchoe fedtschenkoi TaxID=63787 RepID=A0A7N0RDI9_KALFE